MINRIFSKVILIAIISSFFYTANISSANSVELTEHGKEALAQIAECINRDDKNTLNVLYLIDESGSLTRNDPDSVRTEALISSLGQFADASITRPYYKINRAFTTFGSRFKVQKGWTTLDRRVFESDIDWIRTEVPNLIQGKSTDWEAGLTGSLAEFAKVKSGSSCDVLVWFTDGGINVSESEEAVQSSMQRICGVNPSSGAKTSSNLIDQFRKQGIWIQGILLKNEEVLTNPAKYGLTESFVKSERSRMSYFAVVVEQKGRIDPLYFNPSSTEYVCGSPIEAFGLVQTVENPVDIIWPTEQFNCLSTGGRALQIKDNKITIDPGISNISVTSLSEKFQLKGPNGEVIANERGAVSGNVEVNFVDNRESVLQVTGMISTEKDSAMSSGTWTMTSSNNEKAVVCAYLNLELQISAATCYAGETCEFLGTITRQGLQANLKEFSKVKIQAGQLDSLRSNLPEVQLNDNSFSGTLEPPVGTKELTLGALLTLKTASGIEFIFSTKKPIAVIPAGLYPSINPDPIGVEDFSSPLLGKSGKAIAQLELKGPSRTDGTICMSQLQVRSDPKPERIEEFRTSISGEPLVSEKCFNLLAGQSKVVDLEIQNPNPANGISRGFLDVSYSATGQDEINSKLDIQFKSEIIYDNSKRLSIFLLLMFLGIGLPLVGLYLLNIINSKILLNNLYLASIPLRINASENSVDIKRIDDKNNAQLIAQEDFVPFNSGIKKVKEARIQNEILEAKVPKSPFGMLKAVISPAPGNVIVSSYISGNSQKYSDEAEASLNPAGLMYVTQTSEANQKLINANRSDGKETEVIEGRLVALLSFDGDPYAQVEKLDSDARFNNGWIGGLLKGLPQRQKTAPRKNVETSKAANSESKKSQGSNGLTSDDDWGGTNDPVQSTDIKDDWGTGKVKGEDDDW